ncbi:neurofilament medium polypeptide-like isoform X2 [Carex littledalei]|uniref:Neurofilament medium polypeptide-like isoform X2 n=1 Tax=Carex littledalei TaxID=544730 RepID=A0A833RGM2_9POAL|nr:neurofilament medium polypeptide-like isoform X2 [Carex littledalei]
MGEEVKKEEETKEEVKEEGKKEEEAKGEEEKKQEAKGEEEKKEEPKAEEPPAPPPPVVLQVDLHCVGCAKKIQRSILKCKGVEGVEVEMGKNLVTVKGIVDPQALCNRIQKKMMRKATIISPVLPPPPPEGEAQPLVVLSQVNEATTIELKVNMHCEACAQQLQKKIQRMRGVQTVETNLGAAKVTVTGTVTGEKLVEYIHRRTGKLASVIPPPPPPKEEEKKEEPAEEKPPEEKKEESEGDKKDKEKPPEEGKEKAEGDAKDGDGKEENRGGDDKKEGQIVVATNNAIWHPGFMNHGYMNGGYMNNGFMNNGGYMHEDEMARRMMMMNLMPMPAVAMPMPMPMHMPVYMIEQPPPPPQIFSDENPNACCIT